MPERLSWTRPTSITASNNITTGLTIPFGAHMVDFGVHLEETSVLTMFNAPAFTGAPGTTTINTHSNGGNGLNVLTGSNFTVIHQAALISTNNMMNGVHVDNGSSITLIQSTVTGNPAPDVALTFGSRSDITTSTIGKLTCNASVLVGLVHALPDVNDV